MSLNNSNEFSDDEVFCGKLTLKDLKKIWNKQQQTIHATSAVSSPKNSGDHNESERVLSELSNSLGWDMKLADDSFIEVENMVAKLCVSPENNVNTELNNTLEIVDNILNNPPSNSNVKIEKEDDIRLMNEFKNEPNLSDLSQQNIDTEVKKNEAYNSPDLPQNSPVTTAYQLHKYTEGTTPRDIKQKVIFKTPVQPLSVKKPCSLKKTPSGPNAYQHIISPVASYISNCPIAPLVKHVHPKKPLPGTSSIPKFVPRAIPSIKKNVNLPSVAYKSAKKTRVIDVPDQQKLPQSHWVKKIPTVILNNPPSNSNVKIEKEDDIRLMNEFKNEPNLSDLSQQNIDTEVKKNEDYNSPDLPQNSPVTTAYQLHKYTEFTTPRDIKEKLIFKTPVQPLSVKKPCSLKKTPSGPNAYQHIISPVASYINNCPIAPLVKHVHPKKPLPGTSSIPKFVRPAKPSNKENVNLPSVAYKSAKKTRVIDVPDQQKLPQSHWVKKITTVLPRPLVMKHAHRELNSAKNKPMPQQDDSCADLSYHQAEVSVCTQKSAFKIKKNL